MDGEYRKSRHDTESNGVGGGMPPPYDGVIRHSHTPHFDYYRSTFPGGFYSHDAYRCTFSLVTEKSRPELLQSGFRHYLTYSMTTRRLGSVPVEWVVMLSISCREAWIT